MASSRIPGPLGARTQGKSCARTPGPLGVNDEMDPNVFALMGDAEGPLGIREYLGYRPGSIEELQSFIVNTPNFEEVEETMLRLLGEFPPELIEGDFL